LVHQKKEFSSYYYFLLTLIGIKPDLKAIQVFASVGEPALVQALQTNFPFATQLRCFLHMRRNIKSKLHELNMTSSAILVIISDIFGKVY
jgi:heme/copper-type cytochrome/quinol oxidase subunit 4